MRKKDWHYAKNHQMDINFVTVNCDIKDQKALEGNKRRNLAITIEIRKLPNNAIRPESCIIILMVF